MYTITIKTISYRYITETKCEKSSFEYIVQKQWKYLFDLRVERLFQMRHTEYNYYSWITNYPKTVALNNHNHFFCSRIWNFGRTQQGQHTSAPHHICWGDWAGTVPGRLTHRHGKLQPTAGCCPHVTLYGAWASSQDGGCISKTSHETGIASYKFLKAWAPKRAQCHLC